MTIEQLIARKRAQIASLIEARNTASAELRDLYGHEETDDATEARIAELRAEVARNDQEVDSVQAEIANLESERAADQAAAELQSRITPTGVQAPVPAARVVSEPRVYSRGSDPTGSLFLNDVVQQFSRHDISASDRLTRHMQEERVERGRDMFERAATTTSNYTGLVVPQYLTDEFADVIRAGRPLADGAMRKLPIPATGMTFNIGKGTTGTSVDIQTEGTAVSETGYDDTLMSISVNTAAGSQTVTRQAIDRGIGVDDLTISDLFSAYATDLDFNLLNQATTGLSKSGVATAVTYTDTAPTVAALYPKLLQAAGQAAAALKNKKIGPTVAIGTTLRWYWLLSQLTSSHPAFPVANLPELASGVDYQATYGDGFMGLLPSGVPYIADDNVVQTLGTATNQDEIYFVNQGNSLLWEDPNAPLLIRAEQPSAKQLGVDLVVYGYFAYTFTRRQHAQRISGTGLVAPSF